MGVYIKDMDIPYRCDDCPLMVDGEDYNVCYVNGEYIPWEWTDEDKSHQTFPKPDWCPLVEIQPHRRLIDADELVKKICESKCQCDYEECRYKDAFGSFGCEGVRFIRNAPTVIEAEECE